MESVSSSSKRRNVTEERAAWELANPLTLVGGNRPYHVMSVLLAEHSHSRGILGFLTLRDANNLRSVCTELRDEVADFRWAEMETRIKGRLDLWRICFPHAISANLYGRPDLEAKDFVHLRGIRNLNVSGGWDGDSMKFPDASFEHLHGIQSLDISSCKQLTDATFVHLKGIHTLEMRWCTQDSITDAAFAHLEGVHTLDMEGRSQAAITDAAFVHLEGIHSLQMNCCDQSTITDAAFVNLRGIHTLGMSECTQSTITDAAFVNLRGIHDLSMRDCDQATITGSTLYHLLGISRLNCDGCSPTTEAVAMAILNASKEGGRFVV